MAEQLTKRKFLKLIEERNLLHYKNKLAKLYIINTIGWEYTAIANVTNIDIETDSSIIRINNLFSNQKQYELKDILNKLFYYEGDAHLSFEIYGAADRHIISSIPTIDDIWFEVFGDTLAIKIKVHNNEGEK